MSELQTSVPPHVQILQMGTACWVSRLVCTAASIRLADHLADGPSRRNCRKAMKRGAQLLIVEFVLPEGNTSHFGKLADMVMLAIPGGEERTAGEYETL